MTTSRSTSVPAGAARPAASPNIPAAEIARLRGTATALRWPEGCPEKECRAGGGCRGGLKSFNNSTRCLPACLALSLRAFLRRPELTMAEADTFLAMTRPGWRWEMKPVEIRDEDEEDVDDSWPEDDTEPLTLHRIMRDLTVSAEEFGSAEGDEEA